MMSDTGNSHSARLFFWFLWLSGIVLGFYLIAQFLNNAVIVGNMQLAIPYFFGFAWQCFVQLTSLKRYQNAMGAREPLLIQLLGSVALIIIVVSIFALKS